MAPSSNDVTRAILSRASNGVVAPAELERDLANAFSEVYYVSRSQVKERIEAEVVFGRLERSEKGFIITSSGQKRLDRIISAGLA